jgi:hypothetical protein
LYFSLFHLILLNHSYPIKDLEVMKQAKIIRIKT